MPITFSCPCGRQLQVGDEYAGKRAKCPECAAVVTVPAADPIAPPPPLPSKRAKLAEPKETDDDVAATAGSLNPLERRRRRDEDDDRPSRSYRFTETDDDEDDDRPRKRRRRRDDDDDDEEDDRPRKGLRRRLNADPPRKFWNNRVTGGLTCMAIGLVWFCGGLAFGVLFYFPPILFCIGLVSLLTGLITGRDE